MFSKERAFTIFLIFFSCLLFYTEAFMLKPVRYGDSFEYLFMTRAFQNHLSPNITDDDISSVQTVLTNNHIEGFSSYYKVLYTTTEGKVFSFHFWFYSLLCVPIMFLLDCTHQNILLTFQITNTLFFIGAIWFAFLGLKNFNKKRKFVALFLLINPVIWYLLWWTPEVFSFSLAIISLVYFFKKRYFLAIFFASLASTQNPPIFFISLLYIVQWLNENRKSIKFKNLVLIFLSAIPSTFSSIFFYLNFRTPNLIIQNQRAGIQFVTFQKVYDLIFDLNLGILPYMTIIIILFCVLVIISLIYIRKDPYRVLMIGIIFLMIILSTQTDNWNNDMAGMNRYAIWILPFVVFLIVLQGFDLSSFMRIVYFSGILLQAIILAHFGGYKCNLQYTQLSDISVFVLDHLPQLYSPSQEIFAERVAGVDYLENRSVSVFYANKNGEIRKAISNDDTFEYLKSINHVSIDIINDKEFNHIEQWLKQAGGKRYINFPKTVIIIMPEYFQTKNNYQSLFFP